MNTIKKIRAEIERLNNKMDDRDPLAPNQKAGYLFALADVLSFLDTLESEKPMNQDKELNNEIKAFVNEYGYEKSEDILLIAIVARHFAEWGYLRAAEKYDEIEYNRQRAEESVPNDLEEAAHSYSESDEPLYSPGHRFHWDSDSLFGKQIETTFIAGAKWAFRQGWTFDAHKGAFGICFDGNIDNLLDSLKDKEDVTVQIRKK